MRAVLLQEACHTEPLGTTSGDGPVEGNLHMVKVVIAGVRCSTPHNTLEESKLEHAGPACEGTCGFALVGGVAGGVGEDGDEDVEALAVDEDGLEVLLAAEARKRGAGAVLHDAV